MNELQMLITLTSTAGLGVVLSLFFAKFITHTLHNDLQELKKAVDRLVEAIIRVDERDRSIKETIDLLLTLLKNNKRVGDK